MESTSSSFLSINQESISIQQALDYLKASGAYHRTMTEIIRQYLLEKELESRADLQCSDLQIDQALMDFRVQSELQDSQDFQEWMNVNGVNYEQFRKNIEFGFKVEALKTEAVEPKLDDYFQSQKPILDRVALSRIILEDKDQANQVKDALMSDRSQFGALAQQYSITEDRVANGMMGPVGRGQMPDILKAAIDLAQPGDIIGPLEIDDRFCLFRIEQLLPAVLEGGLKQELKNQLFEQWLQEKIQGLDIKLEVK